MFLFLHDFFFKLFQYWHIKSHKWHHILFLSKHSWPCYRISLQQESTRNNRALCSLLKLNANLFFFCATAAEKLQKTQVNARRRYITVYYKKGLFSLIHQGKFDNMKKQMESMEMEVMEARLIRASELNGEMDDDDTGMRYSYTQTPKVPQHSHNYQSAERPDIYFMLLWKHKDSHCQTAVLDTHTVDD